MLCALSLAMLCDSPSQNRQNLIWGQAALALWKSHTSAEACFLSYIDLLVTLSLERSFSPMKHIRAKSMLGLLGKTSPAGSKLLRKDLCQEIQKIDMCAEAWSLALESLAHVLRYHWGRSFKSYHFVLLGICVR